MRLFLLLLLLPLSLFSQQPFVAEVWLNENRVPVKVTVLLKDAHGYLIAGSDQGLFRYNGSRFDEIGSNENSPVTALSLLQGEVWVGYKNGRIGYVVRDSVLSFTNKRYQPSAAVNAICGRPDSALWLGTEQGIVVLEKERMRQYNTGNGLSDDFIYTLQFLAKDHFLAGTDQGINDVFVKDGKLSIHTVSVQQGLPDNIVRVIKEGLRPGEYWLGMQQGGIALYASRSKSCRSLTLATPWRYGQVNDILPLSSTSAWIATDDGYLLEASISSRNVLEINVLQLPGRKFNALLVDASGNIWCGTNNGISLNTAEYLSHFTLPDPFNLSKVTTMCIDRNNVLWLAQKNDLYRIVIEGGTKRMIPVFKSSVPISVLHCDATNVLWIGTAGKGLWVKETATDKIREVQGVGLANENILSITSTYHSLWIAGLNGVKEFEITGQSQPLLQWKSNQNKTSGIGSDYVYQLYADTKEKIWMATDGAGVCRYDETGYQHWAVFNAAPANVVYTLTEDASGSIWAGSVFKSLYSYQKGAWKNIMDNEVQDIDINLSAVNANATGQIVAVYQRCIDLWYPSNNYFRHFNSRQGWGIDTNARILNCTAKDTEGNVYVPFSKGMLVFKNQRRRYNIKPEITILKVSNNLKTITGTPAEFGPDENYLSFRYDGISFTNPERLSYRYQLKGYSEKWVYTNETVATFPKLPSGEFTFVVQVSLNNYFDDASQVSYPFKIAKPLWLRPWFIVLMTACLILLFYGLLKFRDRKMQRLAQLEQERVLFDYEHLKSQVNPHFLFNSLNTLVNLIEESPANAVDYTGKLSDLYRSMLIYHNKDLITLSEEWKILSAYLHIQQSRFGNALQIQGEPPVGSAMQKKIPPMALQLLVENAIKHNVVSLSDPLVIVITTDDFEIIVRNEIRPKIKPTLESGIGLNNISNRYKLLTKRKVSYGVVEGTWIVQLPLL